MDIMASSKSFGNFKIEKGYISVTINSKIYPLDVICSAAYIFIDKAYVIIDNDPKGRITVELKPKSKGTDLGILGSDFYNELLNYNVYRIQAEKNSVIRQNIIQRALLTNDPDLMKESENVKMCIKNEILSQS